MKSFVTDTHSLLWYLLDSPKLGERASATFNDVETGKAKILVPSIVLAELYFLNRKLNRHVDIAGLYRVLKSSSQFELIPFRGEDALDFEADSAVLEMHDRIIVGVARRENAALLTCDRNITESRIVKTIW